MAEKCIVCQAPIEIVFLEKINGTYIRRKGKKVAVCGICQKTKKLSEI
jgi:Zn-finger protein